MTITKGKTSTEIFYRKFWYYLVKGFCLQICLMQSWNFILHFHALQPEKYNLQSSKMEIMIGYTLVTSSIISVPFYPFLLQIWLFKCHDAIQVSAHKKKTFNGGIWNTIIHASSQLKQLTKFNQINIHLDRSMIISRFGLFSLPLVTL